MEDVAKQNIAKHKNQDFIYRLNAVLFVFMLCDSKLEFGGYVKGAISSCIIYTGIDMHDYHNNIVEYINYGMIGITGLSLLFNTNWFKEILGAVFKQCDGIIAGIAGLVAAEDKNNYDKLLKNVPVIDDLDFDRKDNNIDKLIRENTSAGAAGTGQCQLVAVLATLLKDRDLVAKQTPYDKSSGSNRKNRFSMEINDGRGKASPHNYVRAITRKGIDFIDHLKKVLKKHNATSYVLGWKDQTTSLTIKILMDYHTDQKGGKKGDVDANGNPKSYYNRTLIVCGTPSNLNIKLKRVTVVEKDAAAEVEGNSAMNEEESAGAAAPVQNSSSKGKESKSKYKYRQVLVGKGKLELNMEEDGTFTDGVRTYTINPKAAGRHVVGKIKNPETKKWEALVLFHSPGRSEQASTHTTRICIVYDTYHETEAEMTTEMEKIKQGNHLDFEVSTLLNKLHIDVATLPTSVQGIDALIRQVTPFGSDDTVQDFKCLGCGEKAVMIDLRNLRDQQARYTNDNDAVVGIGSNVVVYHNEEGRVCDIDEMFAIPSTGVITHIDKASSTNLFPLTVTCREDGTSSATNHTANELYPTRQNGDALDLAAIENNTRCINCVKADDDLYDEQLDKYSNDVLAINEDVCHHCFAAKNCGSLKGCSDCLEPTCRGYNKNDSETGETTRAWVCDGREPNEEGGIRLNNDNIAKDHGSICRDCKTAYMAQLDGTTGTVYYKSSEGFFRAIYTAMSEQPDSYITPKQNPNFLAMVGGVDGVARIDAVFLPYEDDFNQLPSSLSEDEALKTIAERIRLVHTNKFKTKNRKSTIKACPDKCDDCKSDDCEWVGKDITDLESFEEYVKHGGTFASESCGQNGNGNNNKRRKTKK